MMRKLYLIIILILFACQILISQELKLIYPNGGEVFEVGTETTITWEGVEDTTKVKLEYSSNNGKSWNKITDEATNLSYEWRVPQLESDSCLVLISHKVISKDSMQEEGEINWQNSYGGQQREYAYSIIQTNDGGYITAGFSNSIDGDRLNYFGGNDYWIVKLNENGEMEWEKSFGGSQDEAAQSIANTSDGGYIVAGYSESSDGDITNSLGQKDYWIVKLNSSGNIEWEKSYGGVEDDFPNAIVQTTDGGYIVAGSSESSDEDITNPKGGRDYWILKLNQDGTIDWQKSYGGSHMDVAYSLVQTTDGGFIVAGYSKSDDGDVSNPKGERDFWIIKLKEDGTLEWDRSIGGNFIDIAKSINQTTDGGYISVGRGQSSKSDFDYLVVKLKQDGTTDWQKSYGGSKNEYANSIIQTKDGNFLVAGYSESSDGDISNPIGNFDNWIVKLTQSGVIDWQKSYGGSGADNVVGVTKSQDGSYSLAGYSNSTDGDVTNSKGDFDFWVVNLSGGKKDFYSDTSDSMFTIDVPDEDIDYNFEYYVSVSEQNSFAVATVILEESTNINLEVYDILGRRIIKLYSGIAEEGKNDYIIEYNYFQSGRYYIKLTTPTITKTEILEVVR